MNGGMGNAALEDRDSEIVDAETLRSACDIAIPFLRDRENADGLLAKGTAIVRRLERGINELREIDHSHHCTENGTLGARKTEVASLSRPRFRDIA